MNIESFNFNRTRGMGSVLPAHYEKSSSSPATGVPMQGPRQSAAPHPLWGLSPPSAAQQRLGGGQPRGASASTRRQEERKRRGAINSLSPPLSGLSPFASKGFMPPAAARHRPLPRWRGLSLGPRRFPPARWGAELRPRRLLPGGQSCSPRGCRRTLNEPGAGGTGFLSARRRGVASILGGGSSR